jgi:hypothetical protein
MLGGTELAGSGWLDQRSLDVLVCDVLVSLFGGSLIYALLVKVKLIR